MNYYDEEAEMTITETDWEEREFYLEREKKTEALMLEKGLSYSEALEEMIRQEDAERMVTYEKEIAEIMRKENVSRERAEMIYIPF
jgi:hypothetical protein